MLLYSAYVYISIDSSIYNIYYNVVGTSILGCKLIINNRYLIKTNHFNLKLFSGNTYIIGWIHSNNQTLIYLCNLNFNYREKNGMYLNIILIIILKVILFNKVFK